MARGLIVIIVCLLFSCSSKDKKEETVTNNDYRPKFHFTPEKNWINDPNGLVYIDGERGSFDGEYHLFYQYNPYGDKWGHMSWGHAVSKDLMTWEHLPVALEEYKDAEGDSVMIFSGSAVVSNDTLVAIYTGHKQGRQNQNIAYSVDKGRTFTRYDKNPVLDINRQDFRDPKVFWYEQDKKWVMATVIPDKHKVNLYESKDLKKWNFLSDFGPLGDTTKIWECPDLFPMTYNKWVMIVSNSHPQGGPFIGVQYFIGEFDGKKFTADNPAQYPLYVDYGKDFYAAVTFNNAPDKKRIMIGWATNWAYAGDTPTSPWRGMMSMPRELFLDETENGLRMKQLPITKAQPIAKSLAPGDTIHVLGCVIGYERDSVYLDRRNSGNTGFNKNFPSIERAPAKSVDGKVNLNIYADQSIIEVFINGGDAVISDQVFPLANKSTGN